MTHQLIATRNLTPTLAVLSIEGSSHGFHLAEGFPNDTRLPTRLNSKEHLYPAQRPEQPTKRGLSGLYIYIYIYIWYPPHPKDFPKSVLLETLNLADLWRGNLP